MKNPEWVKGDMKTPGYIKVQLFTSDDIGDFFGFVYRITNTENGRQYIGRKYFYQFRKALEVSLGELNLKATGKNTTEVVTNLMKNVGLGMMLQREIISLILLKDESTMRKPDNSL